MLRSSYNVLIPHFLLAAWFLEIINQLSLVLSLIFSIDFHKLHHALLIENHQGKLEPSPSPSLFICSHFEVILKSPHFFY